MRRRILLLVGLLLLAALLWWAESGTQGDLAHPPAAVSTGPASGTTTAPDGAATLPAGLPPEVGDTLGLVDAGGPFPYRRDGVVFENRERRLPHQPRGYWREYTVPTPGSDDRGARRLVVGRDGQVYYSPDHYRSFRQIRPAGGAGEGTP